MSVFGFSLFGFVAAIAILVTVHEYGHFWVARRLGVKVLRFSIGFGKPIFSWRRGGDPTEYCIAAIPLGGYVKMLDERDGAVAADERRHAFNRQSVAARSAIAAAGPASNFLFAVLAMWLVLVVGRDDIAPVVGAVAAQSMASAAGFRAGDTIEHIDGRATRGWQQHQFYLLHQAMKGNIGVFDVRGADGEGRRLRVDFAAMEQYHIGRQAITSRMGLSPLPPPAHVYRVLDDSPAAAAGLRAGDKILAVDGLAMGDWNDLVAYISPRPGQTVTVLAQRGEAQIALELAIESTVVDGLARGRMGLYRPPSDTIRLRYGPLAAIPAAVDYNWRLAAVTLRSLGRMLSARMSTENLSGPVTIARFAGAAVSSGGMDFLIFLAIISMSLGVLNLLPIPPLDGGHLLYFAAEAVTGRAPSERMLAYGNALGMAALVLLMSLAFYNDIMRLM